MQITLYNTPSDMKVTNKVLNNATVKNCTIKDAMDINHPVLVLQNDVNLTLYNYCYIPNWGYYYIENKGVDNGQRNIIYLSFDPRKSMRADILASSGIVKRRIDGEPYIPDGYGVQTNDIQTYTLPFDANIAGSGGGRFILTVGGAQTS